MTTRQWSRDWIDLWTAIAKAHRLTGGLGPIACYQCEHAYAAREVMADREAAKIVQRIDRQVYCAVALRWVRAAMRGLPDGYRVTTRMPSDVYESKQTATSITSAAVDFAAAENCDRLAELIAILRDRLPAWTKEAQAETSRLRAEPPKWRDASETLSAEIYYLSAAP